MLTPAEELGLSGMNLAGRVRQALHKIPEPEMLALAPADRPRGRSAATWSTSATARPTPSACCPARSPSCPTSVAYIHFVSLTIQNALKRLPELYLQDFAVREVLRISPEEEEWLWKCWGPSHRENNPVFGRLDAVVDFTSPMWKDSLRFVEPNLSGIGGLHLVADLRAHRRRRRAAGPARSTTPSCSWRSARTSASC